jgi:hypothetical protein
MQTKRKTGGKASAEALREIPGIQEAEDKYKSGPHIARHLDVDPATVRRYAREGMPHHVLAPGLVRYRLSEVLEWLAHRLRKTK